MARLVSAQCLVTSPMVRERFVETVKGLPRGRVLPADFKPTKVVYAILLENGKGLTPATLFPFSQATLAHAADPRHVRDRRRGHRHPGCLVERRLERAVAPEGGDGDGPDVVAEGACALAEVEDDADGESVAEAVAEPAQVLGGVGARGRGRTPRRSADPTIRNLWIDSAISHDRSRLRRMSHAGSVRYDGFGDFDLREAAARVSWRPRAGGSCACPCGGGSSGRRAGPTRPAGGRPGPPRR